MTKAEEHPKVHLRMAKEEGLLGRGAWSSWKDPPPKGGASMQRDTRGAQKRS